MLTNNIQNPFLKNLVEWAIAAVLAFALFLFIRHFVFRVADVNGHSMEPTLSHGDFVLLSKVGYWFGEPQSGDIIAFPFRGDPSYHYIKRIIGTPGDVIDFQNGSFIVNGALPYYDFPSDGLLSFVSPGDIEFPFTVDDGLFFVLGDNRGSSKDSRYQAVGLISKQDMLGRAVFRIWPLNRIGVVSPP